MHHYGYQLNVLEDMIPWERDIYVALLIDHLREKREIAERRKQQSKNT